MTVQELIAKLEQCNPNAEIALVNYESGTYEIEASGTVETSKNEDGEEDGKWVTIG